jgi:DNA mismatch repair ATPase MutS
MHNRTEFYKERIGKIESELAALNNELGRISVARLILFLLLVGSIAGAIFLSSYFSIAIVVFLILFGIQVKRNAKKSAEAAIVSNILDLNRNELAFMMGDKSVFADGSDVDVHNHIYATDLDIFGYASLFQAIDRTGTHEGRGLVIDSLLHLPKDTNVIDKRKSALKELENEIEWRQRFSVVGKMSEETPKDMPALRAWTEQPDFFKGRELWIWYARIISVIAFAFIVWMYYVGEFYPLPFFGLIVLNSVVRGFINRPLKEWFQSFGTRTRLFQKFADLFDLVSKKQFTSELAKEHYDKVHEAAAAFKELSRLSNRAEQRMNGLVGPLMNGLFMYDVWNIYAIEQWRLKHRDKVDGWIIALANFDMLNSLANYRFNHPAFVEANVAAKPSFIKATQLGHPLLPFDMSVKNDYELGITSKAHIVTGSNMAGKSTFIRTVGLNLVLALNGLPVCAKEFSCSVISIASCIRITDSLEEHASYFRAELRRLETIVGLIATGEPYLVLLDEILRGTNSDDKRMGTLAFFKKLKDYNCLAILATHDLVLGKLEEQFPEHYSNYCFESEIRGEELYFDYRLRRGVSSSTNATYLMRSLGLID